MRCKAWLVSVVSVLLAACETGGGVQQDAAGGNHAPIADAGPDQSVRVGARVTLDGSSSRDLDGDLLTYHWSFSTIPAGSHAALSSAFAVQPAFVADVAGSYAIDLVVDDGALDSIVDSMLVTAAGENAAPIASAGPDQNVLIGSVVTLDGRNSSDADNDLVTFQWSFSSIPEHSMAVLAGATSAAPTFIADREGRYVISLVVNDGIANSAPDTVVVTAAPENATPVAHAGATQIVETGTVVTLDGSASSDADGDVLSYQWSFTSLPLGSLAVLANAKSVRPTFTPDIDGTYVVGLVVSDGRLNSEPDRVTVIAMTKNATPVADAGLDQFVLTGAVVTLDGRASSDANGDALNYLWTFVSRPEYSTATLSSRTSAQPTFTADREGTYVIRLTVDDGKLTSSPDTVMITAGTAVSGPCAIRQDGPSAMDVALLPDGRIVTLAGTSSSPLLVRYNRDTSGGETIATLTGGAKAIATQVDGHILVAYTTPGSPRLRVTTHLVVRRFDSDGTADLSFGGDGHADAGIAGYAGGQDIVVQSDGKIVVVGYSGTTDPRNLVLVRFLTNGSLDPTFGSNGTVVYITPTTGARRVALQPDGKIVVATTTGSGAVSNVLVLRFLADGGLDTRFGVNGSVVYDGGDADVASSVAVASDGSITVAGSTTIAGEQHILVLHYTASGSPDPLFGRGGAVVGNVGLASDVVVQPTGQIVIAGEMVQVDRSVIALVAKYDANGGLDERFAGRGVFAFAGDDGAAHAGRLVAAGDGSVVTAGSTVNHLLLMKLYDVCY